MVCSLGVGVYAQSVPESATRETDRPLFKKFQEELMRPPREVPPPVEEKPIPEAVGEGVKFFVKSIKLEGLESFPEEDFRPIIEKYENKNVTLEDLNILAKEIEREYLRKGIISACFVPPQDIVEGVVILRVVEAKMGKLHIPDHKYFKKSNLERYWINEKGKPLRYDEISRSLQLMNKNPDRQVRSTLKAGELPETTDVYLDVKTKFPLHFSYSYDNEGTITTGLKRRTLGIKHNNFLGLDDTLVAGYQYGGSFNSKYIYHTIPVSSFGTSVMLGYTYSRSSPQEEYADQLVNSRSKTVTAYIYQDLYRKDEYLGDVYLGFDAKDKVTNTITNKPLNKDRLRIFRYGGDFYTKGFGQSTHFKPEISQGINLFGARRKTDFSSRDAKNTFVKLSSKLTHKRTLPFLSSQLSLKLEGQIANEKLAPQEEMYLGGIDSVRGYPSGDYAADNAFQTNLEFLMPAVFIPKTWRLPYAARSLRDSLTLVAFYDNAFGKKLTPSSTERTRVEMHSVGAGIRASLYNQALLRVEFGIPIGNNPIEETSDTRVHISIDFEDQLPQEIARMKKLIEEGNIEKWVWDLLEAEFARKQSPLRQKLDIYRALAEEAQEQGDLETAKAYYEKIMKVSQAIYLQTQEYIRDSIERKKELYEYNKLAQQSYREGKFKEAKKLWKKIVNEAKIEPLVLEF